MCFIRYNPRLYHTGRINLLEQQAFSALSNRYLWKFNRRTSHLYSSYTTRIFKDFKRHQPSYFNTRSFSNSNYLSIYFWNSTPEDDKLFHPFSSSPSPKIRSRAEFIKSHAYCSHESHVKNFVSDQLITSPESVCNQVKQSGNLPPAHVSYECPHCGIPLACCEEHFADILEKHINICDLMRQSNEDEHDLVSGREFPEFNYPGVQMDEALINMTNWDTLFYTREFTSLNSERSIRHVTKLLTYPLTIASVVHELSPYNIRKEGRLTIEGLRSFTALRRSLHPPKTGAGPDVKGLRLSPPPIRIFVVGARAEASLPRDVWAQLGYLFPRCTLHIQFFGPEALANRNSIRPEPTPENPFGAIIEDRFSPNMKISTIAEYYHTVHQTMILHPFDPYFDVFVLFHPGIGHPASSECWKHTIPLLLETKCPVIVTGYSDWDMQRDWNWVTKQMRGEVDMLLQPGENIFRSLRWDLHDLDTQVISAGNWGVWSFRGKLYEAATIDETFNE